MPNGAEPRFVCRDCRHRRPRRLRVPSSGLCVVCHALLQVEDRRKREELRRRTFHHLTAGADGGGMG